MSNIKQNYMQIIEGSTMYYEWYVKALQRENEQLKKDKQVLEDNIRELLGR